MHVQGSLSQLATSTRSEIFEWWRSLSPECRNPPGWMLEWSFQVIMNIQDLSTALSSYPFIPEGLKRRSEAKSDLNLYEYINGWPSDIVQIAQCFPLHLYNSRLHWFYRIQSRSWWNRWRIAPQKPLDRHENTFNNFRISAKTDMVTTNKK